MKKLIDTAAPHSGPAIPPAPAFAQCLIGLSIGVVAWIATYSHLTDFADWMVARFGLGLFSASLNP